MRLATTHVVRQSGEIVNDPYEQVVFTKKVADELDKDTTELMSAVQRYETDPSAENWCQSLVDKIQPTIQSLPIPDGNRDHDLAQQVLTTERFYFWHARFITVWTERAEKRQSTTAVLGRIAVHSSAS